MKILSLDTQEIQGWLFKVSMNNVDESLIIIGFHPQYNHAVVRRFDDADFAYEWVNALTKSTQMLSGEGLDG